MFCRLMQLLNAESPILVILLGNITDLIEGHFANVSLPIDVIVLGNIKFSTNWLSIYRLPNKELPAPKDIAHQSSIVPS
jgi:hypothetical protein